MVSKEAKVKNKQTMDIAMICDDDEGQTENQQKKRKKDKMNAKLDVCDDEWKAEKRKKKKHHNVSFEKETGAKDIEKETALSEGEEEMSVVREKGEINASKADKKEKKSKEKKTNSDATDKDEPEKMLKKLAKEKKQNGKERGDEVEDGNETNGNKDEKRKEKKRKEKKAKGDVTVGDKDHKGDALENCEETNGNKEKRKKEKKRKEKNTEVDMTAGDKELKKKVKEKKEEGGQDRGKKRKLDADDKGGEATSESKKSIIRKAIAPDSSNHQKAKKVTFADEVNVYPLAEQKTTESDGLVRGKRFTKEEDEIIRKAVHDYIEANHLGDEGLNMILHCRKHRKLMYCWEEIGAALPHRPCSSVYYRAHNIFERSNSKWTPEELELLKQSYEKHGPKYKELAEELGRHRVHVKDAVRRLKFPNANRGRWSQEEYQTLYELVSKDLKMKIFEEKKSKHGMLRDNIAWEAISTKMGTRLFDSCCEKWYKQLRSPMVAEGNWADADDYRLLMSLDDLDASCEDEVDWDYLLEHRSGELCRKRWKQMVNHLGENGNKSFSEQVEVLSNRYFPDMLEIREKLDAKPFVD